MSNAQLIILLLLKIMAGIFYGWIGIYYGQFAYMYDTWGYHYASVDEYKVLVSDPGMFLSNLFSTGYDHGYGRFLASHNSYWNDLKNNSYTALLAIFNVFSFGNYYVNVIFYSFLTLFGPIALYRVMNDVFPGKKIQIILATFALPSFIYWTSGIHKDGLIFTALALIIYHFYFLIREKKFSIPRILVIIAGLLLLLTLRNFMLLILAPALFAWFIASRFPARTAIVYILVYSFSILAFFTAKYISPSLDFPSAVVEKQKAFMDLQGSSAVEMRTLTAEPASFMSSLPRAVASTFLRPHPGDVRHILSLAAAVETNILLLLFLCFLVWHRRTGASRPFVWFCIIFSCTFLITVGYTVNFLGAIVRYRSTILPLLVVPLVCMTDWSRIFQLFANNIKFKNNTNNYSEKS